MLLPLIRRLLKRAPDGPLLSVAAEGRFSAMKLCTCVPGEYPDALEGPGARWAAVVLAVALSFWWLWQVIQESRRLGLVFFRSQFHRLVSWYSREISDFDLKVLRKLSTTRLARYLWFLNVLRWIGAPSIVAVLTAVVARSSVDEAEVPRFVVERVLPEGLLVTFYGLYFSKYPKHLDLLRADMLFGFVFLCLGAHTIFSTSTYQYIQISRLVYASQIMVAVAMGNSSRVLPLNVVSTLWQFFVVRVTPALHQDWFDICIDIWVASTFTFGVSIFTETWLVAEARALVGEMEASRSEAAVQNLLSLMCDAVVPLDPELKLRGPCPRLHAMLCRGAPLPTDTDTPSFTKYIREDDLVRFQEFVQSAWQQGQASSIHIHLLDAMSNAVPVQLFHTSVLDNNLQQNHLIGIQEDRGRDQDYFPPGPPETRPRQMLLPEDRLGSSLLTDESVITSDRSDTSSIAASSVASGGNVMDLQATDDFLCSLEIQLKVSVTSESPASSAMFNFSSADSTEAFLAHFRDSERIFAWLRHICCSMGAGLHMKEVDSFGTVRIMNALTGVDYKAELLATNFDCSEVSAQTLPMCELQIHLMQPVPNPKRKKRNRSRSRHYSAPRLALGDLTAKRAGRTAL